MIAAWRVAPASCRLSRGRLALGRAGEDARRTAAGTAALRSVVLAFSLPQVRLFVSQIVVGVAEDHLLVFFIQVAAEFPRGAHPEGVRLHDRFLRDQGAGGDDG